MISLTFSRVPRRQRSLESSSLSCIHCTKWKYSTCGQWWCLGSASCPHDSTDHTGHRATKGLLIDASNPQIVKEFLFFDPTFEGDQRSVLSLERHPCTLSPGSIFGLLRNGTWTVCAPSWRGVFWLIGSFYQFMVMICTGFWLAKAQPEGPHYCLSFRTAWRYSRSLNCILWRGHLSVKRGWRLNGPFGRIDSP